MKFFEIFCVALGTIVVVGLVALFVVCVYADIVGILGGISP